MLPLPNTPTTLNEFVEADLRRAARLIIRVQDDLDPQIRITTPNGDTHIAMTLPNDGYDRRTALHALATFIAWRGAIAFTFAAEIVEPDALYCAGVSRNNRCCCMTYIQRQPRPWTASNFGPVVWPPPTSIDPELVALLPPVGPRAFTPKDAAACNAWFGPDGRFPAVHLPSGAVIDKL